MARLLMGAFLQAAQELQKAEMTTGVGSVVTTMLGCGWGIPERVYPGLLNAGVICLEEGYPLADPILSPGHLGEGDYSYPRRGLADGGKEC